MQYHIRDRPCATVPLGIQIVSYSEMQPQAAQPHIVRALTALSPLRKEY